MKVMSHTLREELRKLAANDRDGSPADAFRARARGRLRLLGLAYATRPPAVMWHVTDEGRQALDAEWYDV